MQSAGGKMLTFELQRMAALRTCVMGCIAIGADSFVTLELPWRDNKKGESCIPCGRYVCRRVCSPKFGDTFEICGVENRSNILFHRGNYYKDTRGCVLLGESVNISMESICESRKAFQRFMKCLEGVEEFNLIVR